MRPPRSFAELAEIARGMDDRSTLTHRHSERVAALVGLMADRMGMDRAHVAEIRAAALVHDVGKVMVPDAILTKPGPLDPDEVAIIQHHAAAGADLVRDVMTAEQARWIRHHHERIDGTGYPDGLAGHAIPIESRLIAVADAYDAMVAHRVYRAGMNPIGVLDILRQGAGTQWCEHAVDLLIGIGDDAEARPARPRAVRRTHRSAQPVHR